MKRHTNTTLIPAHPPWRRSESVEEAPKYPAERQEAAYVCEKGCEFTVTLAADATPPAGWDCRCGAHARLKGSPLDAPMAATFPGYSTNGRYVRDTSDEVTPQAQLMKRRTVPALEALLAERLKVVRAQREGSGT